MGTTTPATPVVIRRAAVAAIGIVTAVLAVLGPARAPSPAVAFTATPALQRAVVIARPSLVHVVVDITGSLRDRTDGRLHGPFHDTQSGTGWFADSSGDVVTAAHVAAPSADEIKLTLVLRYISTDLCPTASDCNAVIGARVEELLASSVAEAVRVDVRVLTQDIHLPAGGTAADAYLAGRPARILASSPSTSRDVAVLHIAAAATPAVTLRPSAVTAGAQVAVIGFPPAGTFTVAPTYTYGSVVGLAHGTAGIDLPRGATAANLAADATVVQIDALAEHGDSGGPSVDEAGHVIGLVSFGADPQGPIRAAFVISADDVRAVLVQAGVVNALGAGDEAWRAGLSAFDRGDTARAAAGFRRCELVTPTNTGCHEWAAMLVSTQEGEGGGHTVLRAVAVAGGVVAALALAGALTLRMRSRRRARLRRRLFRS